MNNFNKLAQVRQPGRVCKMNFAHAGEISMVSLYQITDERNVFVNEQVNNEQVNIGDVYY